MQKGRVYKLTSPETDKIYIGSTFKTLHQRLIRHKQHYRAYLRGKHNYYTSYDIIKLNDCKIELLEEKEVENKKQLREIEKVYMANNNCVNKFSALLTETERREYAKQYKNNQGKELILCACGLMTTKNNKFYHLRTKKHLDSLTLKNQ